MKYIVAHVPVSPVPDERLDLWKPRYPRGHTPGCVAYEIGDHLFVGDVLFSGSLVVKGG